MKISWIIFTVLLVCAYSYIDHRQNSSVAAAAKPATARAPSASQSGNRAVSPTSMRLADSMQAKINYIEQNARKNPPTQTPTVMTEEEVNAYLASGRVQLPQGVNKVRLQGQSGKVDAFLTVDFDKIREGQQSSNPLLGLFSGVHDVAVETDASGAGGQGKVHVRSASLDGTEIPHMALEYFVDKYITAKYPNIGMDSQFQLPDRIDTAAVGYHKVTVTQK
jgi:hypothetical protein